MPTTKYDIFVAPPAQGFRSAVDLLATMCIGYDCVLITAASRQLRDVLICPHERGVVSYPSGKAIMEHDLLAPTPVSNTMPVCIQTALTSHAVTSAHN